MLDPGCWSTRMQADSTPRWNPSMLTTEPSLQHYPQSPAGPCRANFTTASPRFCICSRVNASWNSRKQWLRWLAVRGMLSNAIHVSYHCSFFPRLPHITAGLSFKLHTKQHLKTMKRERMAAMCFRKHFVEILDSTSPHCLHITIIKCHVTYTPPPLHSRGHPTKLISGLLHCLVTLKKHRSHHESLLVDTAK